MNLFRDALSLENPWIKSWKDEGKKALGYFCTYIPEEIIYAADILPIRIKATGCADTPMGDAYMSSTTCSFTRCCLEMANNKEYGFLDGIVSCNTCDQLRRLYDNIRYKAPFPFHYFISVPGYVSDITLDWFKHELSKFRISLEKEFGVNITEDKLKNAIKLYNETRVLLKKLDDLRKLENPPISGTEMMEILIAGVSIPREQFNIMLTELVKEANNKKPNSEYKARIMLIGSELDDPEYIKVIEDLGGLVVTDSLCYGTRYYWDLVDETLDPLESLANRYLSRISCPRMTDGQSKRIEYMIDLIKKFNINGVIFQRLKFCGMWWGEIFMLRRKLKEENIPFLDLEREYVLSGVGAMKTRVQAFMEILQTR